MPETAVEERFTDLETALAQTLRMVEQTSREMRAFKEEMRVFKEEMRVDREASKHGMDAFREENLREHRRMNKQWGELSNKMGTMVEDLVAPSIPRILRELPLTSGREMDFIAERLRKRLDGHLKEFDVIAVCGDIVLVNETKSTLRSDDINKFIEVTMPDAREFFPEYHDKKFIGALASLSVGREQILHAERLGLVVLSVGDTLMDILNTPDFTPRFF